MDKHLVEKINLGRNSRIYASFNKDGNISLVCIGTYEEVRHRFNQIACLIGGEVMLKLLACAPGSLHSRSAPPGTWTDRFSGMSVGSPDELFSLATTSPSERADTVGYLTWHDDWPRGITQLVNGYKAMTKSMAEISTVFYAYEYKATATVGGSAEVSMARRFKDALVIAKRKGYAPYEEEALLKFVDTLVTARFLHIFHQVIVD